MDSILLGLAVGIIWGFILVTVGRAIFWCATYEVPFLSALRVSLRVWFRRFPDSSDDEL